MAITFNISFLVLSVPLKCPSPNSSPIKTSLVISGKGTKGLIIFINLPLLSLSIRVAH